MNFYFIEKTRVVDCGPPAVKRIFRATAAYDPIPELKSAIAMDNGFKKTEGMAATKQSDSYPGIASAGPSNSVGEDGYSRWAQAATVA